MLRKVKLYWARHRRLFWMLHSAWALVTGALVAYLSHERYQLVGWVVLFLVLTWASTLYFGRAASAAADESTPGAPETSASAEAAETPVDAPLDTSPPSLAHEVTSYLTRIMYQETLFFLLPFYAYSTVVRSPNVVFAVLLAALAAFSCIDIPFDRWLRTKPVFGFVFFSIVAFAALNLLLPLTMGWRVRYSTPIAALVAIGFAIPLAIRASGSSRRARIQLGASALALLVVTIGFPVLVPPVPLRVLDATFATGIDRESLALTDTLPDEIAPAAIGDRLVVLIYVFAPTSLKAQVRLVWKRDGTELRTSRDFEITAYEAGFRAWDAWHPPGGSAPSGDYEVVLETTAGRVVGEATLRVRAAQ